MGVSTKITQIRTDGGYAMTGNQCKGGRINLQEIFGAMSNSRRVWGKMLPCSSTQSIEIVAKAHKLPSDAKSSRLSTAGKG
jgi:hypothetical protein